MQERTARVRTNVTTGGGLPGVFGDDSIFAPTATVVHGVHREHAPADQSVGEIRRRYSDRLGLDDGAEAYLDGRPVGDDVRIGAGATLTFMHRAGEKGSSRMSTDFEIVIKGDSIEVRGPEGQTGQMPLDAFLDECRPRAVDSGEAPLPTGVRYVRSRQRVTVWVHETPPQVWNLKWTKSGPGGPRTRRAAGYRDVVVALPYIIVIAVFAPGRDGRMTLSNTSECFFRNAPLGADGSGDEVLVPGLLNCSLFDEPKGKKKIGVDDKPVVWICTQYLQRGQFADIGDESRRMVAGFQTLMTMLMGAGFNYSSEQNEFCSGFTANCSVDPRVAEVEAWEEATKEDPHFAVTVPWLPTGYTWEEVVDRIFARSGAARPGVHTCADIARVVFNHAGRRSGRRRTA